MTHNLDLCKKCEHKKSRKVSITAREMEITYFCDLVMIEKIQGSIEYRPEGRAEVLFNKRGHLVYPNPKFGIPEKCPFILEHAFV